ncbi:substrate-binding periplasmic protein [Bdellovibrio sp. HCB337]|uniref:substrate-binding periplasmic protein n=1 Tax=Bdellovibrio sp. HCB337 TaxID=3394358 RepID=UPI0039A6388D
MFKIIFILFVCLCPFGTQAQEKAKTTRLSILTEEWPPISFEENDKAQGFAVEIVEQIQSLTQDKHPIQVVPWARGYRELRNQPNVVLFTVIRTEERDKLFTMVGPLGVSEVALYGLAERNLPVQSIEDAKKLIGIAAVNETLFATALQQKGFQNLVMTKNPEQEVRLLAAGRVDLISGDFHALQTALKKAGLSNLELKRYLLIEKSKFYIAFSKGTNPELIKQWKQALKKLKANGTFKKISKKWLPFSEAVTGVEVVGLHADLVGK